MCHDCFEKEFTKFPTEDTWLKFDTELTKKLGVNKMKYLSHKSDGEYLYQCNKCNQLWKLKDPDYSFRGYFLKK